MAVNRTDALIVVVLVGMVVGDVLPVDSRWEYLALVVEVVVLAWIGLGAPGWPRGRWRR